MFNLRDQKEFTHHEEYYLACENSHIISSVAPEKPCQGRETNPDDLVNSAAVRRLT